MPYQAEFTDTFGGEANYSWVRRAVIPHTDGLAWTLAERRNAQRVIMRRAKAAVGLTGVRGTTTSYGDGYEFRPYRSCTVLFVTWTDQDASEEA